MPDLSINYAPQRTLTASETIDRLHASLSDYIEAAYHLGHETLVRQRRNLLKRPGVIHQRPYLESTPRYKTGAPFGELGLPDAAREALEAVAHPSEMGGELQPRRLYNPPFTHQARALQLALNEGKSLVVTTGTGSGKTESFLMPILGMLARQAAEGEPFEKPAVRAILLYPMNALVNDQLGRLRLLLGDPRIRSLFQQWAGRPARFARYTSRTLYPGVRTTEKDKTRLRPLKDFYVDTLRAARNPDAEHHEVKRRLYDELRSRGKWPAKVDMAAWWGDDNARWRDRDGRPARCITLPGDAELLTRHEVLAAPPDVLVTNYSMLEYMMMRPVERPIFEETRDWLARFPQERLLLVIDEAHLYRGASGAEVALLLRRLRERLGIDESRLQVIITSASFNEQENARRFASDLTGLPQERFEVLRGDLALRNHAAPGTPQDAALLASLDLDAFYGADEAARRQAVQPFLDSRGVEDDALPLETALFEALAEYPPMSLLVNRSMEAALNVDELGTELFPGANRRTAERAVTALMALGSAAREEASVPSLLPCRVHAFFRGLPGLWACMDPQCTALDEADRGGPTGRLYAQPREVCDCGARVFELYTCRSCGTAHARAYSENPERPLYLWSEPGEAFRLGNTEVSALGPLDLLLEHPPDDADVEPARLDLVTGRLGGKGATRVREVFLPPERAPRPGHERRAAEPGQFQQCAACGAEAQGGKPPVQDHQTKGDQPFVALISEQLQVQPPSAREPSEFAPLQGRKVLIFSDSRQLAARMAPTVQTLSTRDALRPLIVVGYHLLGRHDDVREIVTLDHLYAAVLLAASHLGVRLRPEQTAYESFHSPEIEAAVRDGVLDSPVRLFKLLTKNYRPPQALAKNLLDALAHRFYGLRALALASIREAPEHEEFVISLPDLPGMAESDEQKRAVLRLWFQHWLPKALRLSILDAGAIGTEVQTRTGSFDRFNKWLGPESRKVFKASWLPDLLKVFAEQLAPGKYRLKSDALTLDVGGPWAYCDRCRTTQRPIPGHDRCVQCQAATVRIVDPDTDPVFSARKGYYRTTTLAACATPPEAPLSLLAAEHTAQLNAVQQGEVFSDAERHELLFQDVDLGPDDRGHRRYALDVLSCTTTMEVGIDIGSLSGVALRNLPPARSNYQQRAGRAGRRGNAVASVVAFGSADSHDEHYFSRPAEMIRGQVVDPVLTLDNRDITRRHLTAYLLQRYFHEGFSNIPEDDPKYYSLFSALGKVDAFVNGEGDGPSREGFATWLQEHESELRTAVDRWLPSALSGDDRQALLDGLVDDTLRILDEALDVTFEVDAEADSEPPAEGTEETKEAAPEDASDEEEADHVETDDAEHGSARDAQRLLLDRLLFEGVLPRYAFPTDVAGFHVFDVGSSTSYRPAFLYAPQQGLTAALSQYAPGKQLYIGNQRWTSGALYDPNPGGLFAATSSRESYVECERCGYAETKTSRSDHLTDCPACGETFERPRSWIRPPGFAHPFDLDADTSPDAPFVQSYATRAKLVAPVRQSPDAEEFQLNERVSAWRARDHLLVTNRGPQQMGYHLCVKCGRIERSAQARTDLAAPHTKPYPAKEAECPGMLLPGVVLGTKFISDVLLLAFRLDRNRGVVLPPGTLGTEVALRTLSEALAQGACDVLQIEPGEVEAEFRPAIAQGSVGREGSEVEVYLYDTLPGGAGFAHLAADRLEEVLRRALDLLENCPEDCDASCYRCLRKFTNRFEHDRLDRHVGADLLRYLLDDALPSLDARRQTRAMIALAEDLRRALGSDAEIERDATVDVPGMGPVEVPLRIRGAAGTEILVAASSPVAPSYAPTQALRDAQDFALDRPVRLVDEMLVRKNLPRATNLVRSWVGTR